MAHGRSTHARRRAGDRARVLWADDNTDLRDYLRRLLEKEYEVEIVSDGEAALEVARLRPPDLVLSDVVMRHMDGFELLRKLRDDPQTRKVPVILLSGQAREESRVEGLHDGADDYLVKPFSGRELLARVGAHINLARVRHESDERVTRIFESLTEAFQIIDSEWRITYMNPVARKFFAAHGMDPDSMIGKHFWEDLFPEVRDSDAADHMRRAMTERVPVAFENYYAPWDAWMFSRFDPLPDGGLANYYQDITEPKRTEEKLRQSQALLAEAQHMAGIGSWSWDPVHHALEWSDEHFRLFGMEPRVGGITYERAREHVHPDDRALIDAIVAKMLHDHEPFEVTYRSRHPDGTERLICARGQLVLDEGGTPVRMFGTAQDITERTRAEEAVRQVTTRLELATRGSDIGIWEFEAPDGTLEHGRTVFNNVWEQLDYAWPGSGDDDPAGTTLVHPDDRGELTCAMNALLQGRIASLEVEQRLRHRDGSYRTMLVRAVRRDEGGLIRVIGSRVDITDRKRAEEARRESERDLAAGLAGMVRLQEVSTRLVRAGDSTPLLLDIVDAAIAITGADMGNIQLLNPGSGMLEIVASRGFERPFLDYFNAVHEGQAACGAAMRNCARIVVGDVTASPVFVGTPALDVMLAARALAVQSTPLVSRSGRLVGMLSTHYHEPRVPGERDLRILDLIARQAADWIERTHAETALRESETKFRTLADATTAVIWFLDPAGKCRYVNRPYLDFFGKTEEEVYGEGWHPLVHPDDAPAYIAETLDSIRERRPLHCRARVRRHDQQYRWIESHALPHFGEDGRYLGHVGNSVDISDSLEASAVLRESEERYRSLISQVKDYAIFSTDVGGIVTSWNEGCQYVLGYPQQDFIGLDIAELFTPEDRADGIPTAELRQAAEAGTTRNDRWMMARDGRRFFAMGATSNLQDPAGRLIGFSTLMRDLTQMKISQDELVRHGASLERLVTERTDELEKTTERLRLSERMASLGTLSAGLGHDLGNLLLPLDVRLQLLLQADLPPEVREHVIGIQRCLEYLQRLSNGLRLLATDPRRTVATGATEICAWWDDVGILLKNVLPSGITFHQDLPASELWVTIDRAGLTQAVFNLVQNAADALKERGVGRVRISAEKNPRTASVVVRVADDGPGMTEETVRRCMEPYFSTKARGISTGMGLALVHGLVTAAGGRLLIDSATGRGTRMSLILPEVPPEERGGDHRRGVAVVDLKDARMRSFISGEARLLGFDVRKTVNDDSEPRLVVTDDHFVRNHTNGSGIRDPYLIVIGGPVTVRPIAGAAEIVVLGPRPEPETISQALRIAAEKIDAIRV